MSEAIDISTAQRKTLLALLRRLIPGVEVWAYGSRAKWTARPNSDLDLVAFTPPEQSQKISALKEALAESDLPFLVDLHIWSEVPERFHEIIRKEYVVIQEESSNPLPDGWRTLPLEECMAAIIDYRGKTPTKTTFGVPLVTAKIVKGGRIEPAEEFIAESDYEPWMRRGMPEKGDVVMTTEAPLGEVAQLDGRKVALAQRVITLRGKTGLLDNGYLRYLLQSTPVQDELKARATGTTVLGIKQSELRKVRLTLPPLSFQKSTAHILRTLDEKIELNRRMNATLEAMAQALFQSWFVDFDPVKRNAEGGAQRQEYSLFPGSFEDSAVGDIPLGWTVERVGDVVDCVGGGTPSTKEPKFWEDGVHHWTTPKDFSSLQSPILIDTSRKLTNAGIAKISSGLLPAGTLLLSSRAPVGYLAISVISVAINQGFIAMKCNDRASNYFMLNWCQTNMGEIKSRATGTTFPEISKNSFRPISVVIPPNDLMAEFTSKVAPLYSRITANLNQSATLATTRDTLLPALLGSSARLVSSTITI